MLPIKKLYIDSKARSKDSRSTSDFAIDLVESLTMPEHAVFQVCDVLIPHTWYLVDENNCNLYFFELNGPSPSNIITLTLATGNYDGPGLSREIGKELHETSGKLYQYSVTYDEATGRIHITATGKSNPNIGPFYFKVLTDEEVSRIASLAIANPKTLNKRFY